MWKKIGMAFFVSMTLASWLFASQCKTEAVAKERALSYASALRIPVSNIELYPSEKYMTISGAFTGTGGKFRFSVFKNDCSLRSLIREPTPHAFKAPQDEGELKCPSVEGVRLALFSAWAISHVQGEVISESSCSKIDRKDAVNYPISWELGAVDYQVAFGGSSKMHTYFVKLDDTCELKYIVAIP